MRGLPMQANIRRQSPVTTFVNRTLIVLFFVVLLSTVFISIGSALLPAVANITSPLFCPADTTLQARLPERLQLSVPIFLECVDGEGGVVSRVSGRFFALLFVGVFTLIGLGTGIRMTGGYPSSIEAFFNPDERPTPDVPVSMFPQTFLGSQLRRDERLSKLEQDYHKGAISDEEYNRRRREVMGL
jgi:hypothetical protein